MLLPEFELALVQLLKEMPFKELLLYVLLDPLLKGPRLEVKYSSR